MNWRGHTIAFPEFPLIKYEYSHVYTLGSLINTTVESLPTADLVDLISYLVREVATRKYKEKYRKEQNNG